MKTVEFSKMVATGNDFVVVDNRRPYLVSRISYLAKKLCDRKLGVGADGLLLLEKSKRADFKMRIFNPDGSEPQMCGNGSRCIALYAKMRKIVPSTDMTIETKAGILSAKVKNSSVMINMTEPEDIKLGINIEIDKETYQFHYINTGVPHLVYFVKELDRVDVFQIGKRVRYHKAFMPSGTNVDFVQTKGKNRLLMRSYERGVEGETLACGTGAVASAIISSIMKGFDSPVKVHTRGGILNIYFKKKGKDKFTPHPVKPRSSERGCRGANNNYFSSKKPRVLTRGAGFINVFLEGEARELFTGTIKIVSPLKLATVNWLL